MTETLSPQFFLTLGFSFAIGMGMGYALKVAIKLTLLLGGILLVGIFALQYAGLIQVDWTGMETHYTGVMAWLQAYSAGLKAFMLTHLSHTASFFAGVLLGFRL